MNFRGPRREEPEINLTPLIDVVFLMLIFFMISTTFNREAELQIQLPEASAEPTEQREPELLELVINREGRYFLGDREVVSTEAATLKQALADFSEGRRDKPLVISADADAPYQAVIRAMDVAGQLGISGISLTTKTAEVGE